MKSRKGISPVIATIIIVAVAIAIAIAVAYWVVGIAGIFTRFEKLEISAAWYDSTNTRVILKVKNTGSADATVTDVFVNGIPGATLGGGNSTPFTLKSGDSATLYITNPPSDVTGGSWTSGVTYEITLHTASGKDYPKAVAIP